MKATSDRHPLHYVTLPARQMARRALVRRLQRVVACAARVVAWSLIAGLAAFGLMSLAVKAFLLAVTP